MISADLWRQLKPGLLVLAAGFDKDDDAEIWYRAGHPCPQLRIALPARVVQLSCAALRRQFHSANVPIAVRR